MPPASGKIILMALGLACTVVQMAGANNFSKQYVADSVPYFASSLYGLSYGVDESLLTMICEQRPGNLTCWFNLKMTNNTEKLCAANIIENDGPHYYYISLHGTMVMGNTAVVDWGRLPFFGNDPDKWVSFIDMDTCRPVHVAFPNVLTNNNANFQVVAYNNSVHVLVDSEEECNDSVKPCLLRYNRYGTLTDKLVSFPSMEYNKAMVASSLEPRSGVFYSVIENREDLGQVLVVKHMGYNGSATVLFNGRFVTNQFMVMKLAKRSNGHGYHSLCLPDGLDKYYKYRCIQFGSDQAMVMDVEVTLEKDHSMLEVFNRRNGDGLVILYLNCTQFNLYNCRSSHVKVKVVNAKGEEIVGGAELAVLELERATIMVKPLKINQLETDTEHCFYFAFIHKVDPRVEETDATHVKVEYLKRCMNKENSEPEVVTRDCTLTGGSRTCMNSCMSVYLNTCMNRCIVM